MSKRNKRITLMLIILMTITLITLTIRVIGAPFGCYSIALDLHLQNGVPVLVSWLWGLLRNLM